MMEMPQLIGVLNWPQAWLTQFQLQCDALTTRDGTIILKHSKRGLEKQQAAGAKAWARLACNPSACDSRCTNLKQSPSMNHEHRKQKTTKAIHRRVLSMASVTGTVEPEPKRRFGSPNRHDDWMMRIIIALESDVQKCARGRLI